VADGSADVVIANTVLDAAGASSAAACGTREVKIWWRGRC